MKKKIINTIIATFAFATMSFTSVLASDNVTVELNGMIYNLEVEPIISDNGYTLVAFREIADMMMCETVWEQDTKTATIIGEHLEIIAGTDMRTATVNGLSVILDTQSVIVNDRLMVPLRFIAESFGYDVSWVDSERKVVLKQAEKVVATEVKELEMRDKISRGTGIISLLNNYDDFLSPTTEIMTFKEAVSKAYTNNDTIDSLENSLESTQMQKEDLLVSTFNTANVTVVPGTGSETYINAIRSLESMNVSMLNMEEQKETIKLITEQSVMSGTMGIMKQHLNEISYMKSLENEKKNLENTTLLHELGQVSDVQFKEAEDKYNSQLISYDILLRSTQTQKESFNQLLGINLTKDIFVEYAPVFFEPDNGDIIYHLYPDNATDPNLKAYERAYDLATYSYRLITSETEREIFNLKLAVDNAELDISNYKKNYEETVRSYYSNLLTLQDQQQTILINLDQAWVDYNNLYLNYEAGNVTEYQLMLAEYAILSYEIQYEDNILQQATVSFILENPYLVVK